MKTLLAIFSFVGLLVLNTTNCMAYDRVNSYQDLISRINNRNNSVETLKQNLQSINKIERIPISRDKTSINKLNNGGYYIKITNRSWKESQNEVLVESGYIFEI